MKKIVGAVWELPAKQHSQSSPLIWLIPDILYVIPLYILFGRILISCNFPPGLFSWKSFSVLFFYSQQKCPLRVFFIQFWILIFLLSKDTPGINFGNTSHLSYVQVGLSVRLISSNNHKRILRNRATAFWAGISLCVEFHKVAEAFMKLHFNFNIYAIWRGYTFKLVPSGVKQTLLLIACINKISTTCSS